MEQAIKRVRVPLLAPSKLNKINGLASACWHSFAHISAFFPSKRQLCASTAVLVASAAFAMPAYAENDLLLMGKSWHFGHSVGAGQTGYDVNQYNWGGGLEHRGDAWHGQWLVGALTYRDTFRQQAYTVYGGYQFTVPISSDISVFATVRAGYLNGSGHHGPGALPSFGITYKRVSLEATYIPPAAKDGYNCIAIFGRIAF